jgi:hypothetical protein
MPEIAPLTTKSPLALAGLQTSPITLESPKTAASFEILMACTPFNFSQLIFLAAPPKRMSDRNIESGAKSAFQFQAESPFATTSQSP